MKMVFASNGKLVSMVILFSWQSFFFLHISLNFSRNVLISIIFKCLNHINFYGMKFSILFSAFYVNKFQKIKFSQVNKTDDDF